MEGSRRQSPRQKKKGTAELPDEFEYVVNKLKVSERTSKNEQIVIKNNNNTITRGKPKLE